MFTFELGTKARIAASGETGVVTARAEYFAGENMYHLRYKAADGRAVEAWWPESAVEPATEEGLAA
jgi:hypothetical protein